MVQGELFIYKSSDKPLNSSDCFQILFWKGHSMWTKMALGIKAFWSQILQITKAALGSKLDRYLKR